MERFIYDYLRNNQEVTKNASWLAKRQKTIRGTQEETLFSKERENPRGDIWKGGGRKAKETSKRTRLQEQRQKATRPSTSELTQQSYGLKIGSKEVQQGAYQDWRVALRQPQSQGYNLFRGVSWLWEGGGYAPYTPYRRQQTKQRDEEFSLPLSQLPQDYTQSREGIALEASHLPLEGAFSVSQGLARAN